MGVEIKMVENCLAFVKMQIFRPYCQAMGSKSLRWLIYFY